MASNDSDSNGNNKMGFPAWVRELCYFGAIIVTMSFFLFNIKANGQSTSDKVDRLSEDVRAFSARLTTIEQRLPNKEADDLKLDGIRKDIHDNQEWVKYEIAKLVKWQGDVTNALVRKGVMQ